MTAVAENVSHHILSVVEATNANSDHTVKTVRATAKSAFFILPSLGKESQDSFILNFLA